MLMIFQDWINDQPAGEPYPLRVSFGLWLHGREWAARSVVEFENEWRASRGNPKRMRFVSFNE